jgi:hypothetical protein
MTSSDHLSDARPGQDLAFRVTGEVTPVECFFLLERGCHTVRGKHGTLVFFPEGTRTITSAIETDTVDGLATRRVTVTQRALPDGSLVLCYAQERERGVPTFEATLEIRSPQFDLYRLLTGRVADEDRSLLQQAGVRFEPLPEGGQIVVFPQGTRRRYDPEYRASDGDGPDLNAPGAFMRQLELVLPSWLTCLWHEALAVPRQEEDRLEYVSWIEVKQLGFGSSLTP